MQKPITLVIMAAGTGSRYGGPKQIDPAGPNGELIIDYSIYDAVRAGFNRIVFIVSDQIKNEVAAILDDHISSQVEIRYVVQRTESFVTDPALAVSRQKPWGTAHAILCCQDTVSGPFAVINADDFYGPTSYTILYQFLSGIDSYAVPYQFAMVGYQLENTLTEHGSVARGLCTIDPANQLRDVVERTKITAFPEGIKYEVLNKDWVLIPPGAVVSMNLWGFTPQLFGELEREFNQFIRQTHIDLSKYEFFIPSVVNTLIKRNKATVTVLPSTEKWFGVTYAEDMPRVRLAIGELIRKGVYPEKL